MTLLLLSLLLASLLQLSSGNKGEIDRDGGPSDLGRRAEQRGAWREGDVETLWRMTGVLSFLVTSFHPSQTCSLHPSHFQGPPPL